MTIKIKKKKKSKIINIIHKDKHPIKVNVLPKLIYSSFLLCIPSFIRIITA